MKSCSCPLQVPHHPIVFCGKALSSMHARFGSFNSPVLWSVFDAYLKEFPKQTFEIDAPLDRHLVTQYF